MSEKYEPVKAGDVVTCEFDDHSKPWTIEKIETAFDGTRVYLAKFPNHAIELICGIHTVCILERKP